MGQYYFDTSALVKRYRPEQGTDKVDKLFADEASSFVISRLAIVETVSALALKVRSGELVPADYSITRKKFLGEIAARKLRVARLLVAHYRSAERLIDRYGTSRRFRTLDALQLGAALELRQKGAVDMFGADEVLCEVALMEGLAIVNPLVSTP